jgi:hypothetical protein
LQKKIKAGKKPASSLFFIQTMFGPTEAAREMARLILVVTLISALPPQGTDNTFVELSIGCANEGNGPKFKAQTRFFFCFARVIQTAEPKSEKNEKQQSARSWPD